MPSRDWWKKSKSHDADQGPRPGDFPLGSVESRAAARAAMEQRNVITGVIEFVGTGERYLTINEEQPDGTWSYTRRRLVGGEGAPQKPLSPRLAK